MAEKSKVCTVCDKRYINRQPIDWCLECDQALCAECKEYHANSEPSQKHATIPIADYLTLAPIISPIVTNCSDHGQKCQFYCSNHDSLLCVLCIKSHSECKDVIPLMTIAENVKKSEAFHEAGQCLVDIDENILKIENNIQDKIRIVKQEKKTILSEISKLRQKINKHLDKIEEVITENVSDVENKTIREMDTVLTVLKEKKEQNVVLKQHLENIRQHSSDLQKFFGLRQISSGITATESFLQSIVDNGSMDKLELELSVNENIKNILSAIQTFGSVHIKRSPFSLSLVERKERKTQSINVQWSTSMQEIKLKLLQTFDTNIDTIRGCDILADEKMIFCDHSSKKRLVVTDTYGKHLFEVALNGAFDVACISDTTVAVTTGQHLPLGINIIDISSRKILKFIAKEFCCFGITSLKGKLIYCVKGKGIEIMDVNSQNATTIVNCNLPFGAYIAAYNDKLYYTNKDTNTVNCCDMRGNTIWAIKDEKVFGAPLGISVDDAGHVYVVSSKRTSVVAISCDGQQSRQLLSKADSLTNPIILYYEKRRTRLWVANDKACLLFQISS